MKFPIDIKGHLREFEILFPDNLWGEYMLRTMLQMANAAYKQIGRASCRERVSFGV